MSDDPGPTPAPAPATPAVASSGGADRAVVIGRGVTWAARWSWRWLLVAAGAVLIGVVVTLLWSVLLPVVLALVLTTVLQPPAQLLERRFRLPAAAAAAVVVLGAVVLVVAVLALLVPSVASQAGDLATSASGGLDEVRDSLRDSGLDVSDDQVQSAVSSIQDRLRSSARGIASGVLTGVSAIGGALVDLLITLVLSFFFLKDGRRFLPWVERVVGPSVGGHVAEVATRSWATLGGFVRTQALVGLIDAVLIGTGLVVIGVPLALPLTVLTFVAAFAPVVGAVTVGALAVLVALVSNGWVAAVVVLVIVLVVQQLEGNVLLPYLQGKSLDLHAAVVLLAVVLGSTLFGVAGAFLAVPVVAVSAVVVRYLGELVTAAAEASALVAPD